MQGIRMYENQISLISSRLFNTKLIIVTYICARKANTLFPL